MSIDYNAHDDVAELLDEWADAHGYGADGSTKLEDNGDITITMRLILKAEEGH